MRSSYNAKKNSILKFPGIIKLNFVDEQKDSKTRIVLFIILYGQDGMQAIHCTGVRTGGNKQELVQHRSGRCLIHGQVMVMVIYLFYDMLSLATSLTQVNTFSK